MSQAERRAHGAELPREKETRGKRDGSLTQTIGVSEAGEDGEEKDAVQQGPDQVGQLLSGATASKKKKNEPVDTGDEVTDQNLVEQNLVRQ